MGLADSLKQRFVTSLLQSSDGEVDEKWSEVKQWLVQAEVEFLEAIRLMLVAAAEENKPFDEKYQAREKLETLLREMQGWWEEAEVVRCFKGLVLHRLGTNFYETEEMSMGEKKMQESSAVWKGVSKQMQMNFANCI